MEKNKFKAPEYLLNSKHDAIKNCSILYCGKNKSISESLIPFGWEHGDGWNSVVSELSYKLEALNLLFYPKYGIRIEAMQVKEKFGTLHFYYDIVTEPPLLIRFIPKCLERLYNFIRRKVDFGYKSVCDKESCTTEEWEEISEDDFNSKKTPEYTSNDYGWKFKSESGKFYRNYCLHHPAKYHREVTKNKFVYSIQNLIWKFKCMMDFSYSWHYPKSVSVIRNFVDSLAEKYVEEAVKKCYGVCEVCGMQIGTDFSKRYTTTGWIRHVCEYCINREGWSYFSENGDILDSNGNLLKPNNRNKENG